MRDYSYMPQAHLSRSNAAFAPQGNGQLPMRLRAELIVPECRDMLFVLWSVRSFFISIDHRSGSKLGAPLVQINFLIES